MLSLAPIDEGRAGMTGADTNLMLALREVALRIADEPRPQPVLRVGGIGRRKIDPDRAEAMKPTLRKIFAMLRANAERILQTSETNRWYAGPLDCAVITPLAEGADRLIAFAGMAENWRLGSVLPFSIAAYEQTFNLQTDKTPAIKAFRELLPRAALPEGHGVFVLDGKTSSKDETDRSFQDCAAAIIHRSDFVIAIVEHTSSLSQTGASVREAIALRVPLILVHPEQPDRFRLVLGGKEIPDSEDQSVALAKAVRDLFPSALPGEEEDRAAILEYVGEPVRCAIKPDSADNADPAAISDFESTGPCVCSTHAPFWIRLFSGVNAFLRKGLRWALRRGKNIALPKLPEAGASTLSFDPETAKNFARLFMHFHRADQAANAYAELQRSAYIVQAVLAIAVGVLSALDLVPDSKTDANKLFSLIILALLGLIGLMVMAARRQHWQTRWVDYRLLAEVLRAGLALLAAGKGSPLASTRESVIKLNPHHWVSCHATNVFRSLKIAVPGRGQIPDDDALDKAHRYVNASYIGGQVRYHAVTADYERKLGRVLDVTSLSVAILIGVAAVLNVLQKYPLLGIQPKAFAGPWLPMLLIILPALAAVLVSLRSYNQFEVVSRRSSAMAIELAERLELGRKFDSFRSFGDHVLEAAHKVLRDVEGWMDIFITKRMES